MERYSICCGLPRSVAVFRRSLRWNWFSSQAQPSYHDQETNSPTSVPSSTTQGGVNQGQESRSWNKHSTSTLRIQSKFFKSRLSPLTIKHDVKSRQFLTSDKQTIVCIHPAQGTPLEDTKPIRPFKPELARQRTSLTEEEVELVRKLRREDGSLWTINTLARFFNVKRVVISKVAPASLERQKELKREESLMASMKFHRRKLYKAEREMKRQKRLEDIISQNEKLASIRAHYQNSN